MADKKKAEMERQVKELMDSPTDMNIVKADRISERYKKKYGRGLIPEPGEPDYAGVIEDRAARKEARRKMRIKNMREATRRMRSR